MIVAYFVLNPAAKKRRQRQLEQEVSAESTAVANTPVANTPERKRSEELPVPARDIEKANTPDEVTL